MTLKQDVRGITHRLLDLADDDVTQIHGVLEPLFRPDPGHLADFLPECVSVDGGGDTGEDEGSDGGFVAAAAAGGGGCRARCGGEFASRLDGFRSWCWRWGFLNLSGKRGDIGICCASSRYEWLSGSEQ